MEQGGDSELRILLLLGADSGQCRVVCCASFSADFDGTFFESDVSSDGARHYAFGNCADLDSCISAAEPDFETDQSARDGDA